MIHFVAVAVEIKSHDNSSIHTGPQGGVGPLVSVKTVNFQSISVNLEDGVKEVHEKLTAYLASDAVKIGVEDKSRITSTLSAFPVKGSLTEQ